MRDGIDAPERDVVEELVKKAQKGDAAAFAGLYEHFYAKMHRYVSFKMGNANEPEDVTEDVFLRMLDSISSFKWQGYPFSSWLFRIAHNLVVDYFRKKGRQKTALLDDAIGIIGATSYDLYQNLDVKLSIKEVNEAISRLTNLQQEVLSLRFAGGLSVRETADAVGKNENAVKALQHAGIKKLRQLLGAAQEATAEQATMMESAR